MRTKIWPKIYASVEGLEPFRTEKYQDSKIEFFYYEQSALAEKFLGRQRFYVWTCNGLDYRLFVEKGYYEKVGVDLFGNKMNDIQLDFQNYVYGVQRKSQRKYLISSGITLALGLGLSFGLMAFGGPEGEPNWIDQNINWLFMVILAIVVVLCYVFSRQSNTHLRKVVGEENAKASEKCKATLGEDGFEKLISEQQEYIHAYFAQPDHDPADEVNEDVSEIDPLYGTNPLIDHEPVHDDTLDSELPADAPKDSSTFVEVAVNDDEGGGVGTIGDASTDTNPADIDADGLPKE